MANIIRQTEKVRVINPSGFSSHTGDVKVQKMTNEDGSVAPCHIEAPLGTIADFNDAPIGSTLWDTTDYLTHYVHDTATTWKSATYS